MTRSNPCLGICELAKGQENDPLVEQARIEKYSILPCHSLNLERIAQDTVMLRKFKLSI